MASNAANSASAPGAASLRWQGSVQLKLGDIFALQLLMQSDQPVVSVPMVVAFDPSVLQVNSVTEGNFLRQGGGQASFSSRVDPSGQILMTGTISGSAGATAVGALASINFRVVAATTPETQIQLLTAAPIGLGGTSIAAPLPAPHVIRIGASSSGVRSPNSVVALAGER